MSTTLTQISNIFNLMTQQETRLASYHFGWRSDINRNVSNNYDPKFSKGREFPALMFEPPESIQAQEEPEYLGSDEDIEILLYFDALQDYNNDGSANTLNLVEQWSNLKTIAKDFMANLVNVLSNKYGNQLKLENNPRYVPRSNLHNAKLITWEVSFTLSHQVPCTDEAFQIDLSQLPDDIPEEDIERTGAL